MGRTRTAATAVSVACMFVWGCPEQGPEDTVELGAMPARAVLSVYVVNYPLQYFAERVGGDAVAVEFPAPADADPAYWQPGAETIVSYQEADLILLNGAGYAKWVAYATLRRARLVDTGAGLADSFIAVAGAVVHAHGPGGAHEHGDLAFTTWLDMSLAVRQAQAVRDALAKARPGRQQEFDAAFEALKTDLLALDEALLAVAEAAADRPLVMSHPVYQYLERRYGLNARSVHWEPDGPSTEDMWENLAALLRDHPARWMVWEGQPSEDVVARLQTMGVECAVFDPCGNVPDDGDFLTVMQANVSALKLALE